MNLIYNKNFVFTLLRLESNLVNERPDVINRVVGCCIQLCNIETCIFIEGCTAVTFIAGLKLSSELPAVEGLCQNSGAGSLTHTAGTAKEEGLRKMLTLQCILECLRHVLLPYNVFETLGSIFTGRDDKLAHDEYP